MGLIIFRYAGEMGKRAGTALRSREIQGVHSAGEMGYQGACLNDLMKGSSIVSKANEKGMTKSELKSSSRNKTLIFPRCAGPQALRALRARRPGEIIGRTPGEIAKPGAYISRRNTISRRTCRWRRRWGSIAAVCRRELLSAVVFSRVAGAWPLVARLCYS